MGVGAVVRRGRAHQWLLQMCVKHLQVLYMYITMPVGGVGKDWSILVGHTLSTCKTLPHEH